MFLFMGFFLSILNDAQSACSDLVWQERKHSMYETIKKAPQGFFYVTDCRNHNDPGRSWS